MRESVHYRGAKRSRLYFVSEYLNLKTEELSTL
jgi:hypothetical protein